VDVPANRDLTVSLLKLASAPTLAELIVAYPYVTER